MPNQDAIAWNPVTAGPQGVAAVSDGHGAAAHYRSAEGALLATDCAVAMLSECRHPGEIDPALLPARLVESWHHAVLRHAAALAPTGGDWVESRADTLLPYGATLVAAACWGNRLLVLQIGDGDLYVGYPDGKIERPLPDDVGLLGEQTHSLCATDAASRVRVATIDPPHGDPGPDFLLLSTDGVSKSFADESAMRDVARHYGQALRGDPTAVFRALPEWLASVSNRGSGDDATLCLGVRIFNPGDVDRGNVPYGE